MEQHDFIATLSSYRQEHVHRYDLSSEVAGPNQRTPGSQGQRSSYRASSCRFSSHIPHSLATAPVSYESLSTAHNTPSPNLVVRVPSEQRLTIRAPPQTNALRLTALLADLHVLRLQLIDLALLLQVEDDDARGGGGAQPVAVG